MLRVGVASSCRKHLTGEASCFVVLPVASGWLARSLHGPRPSPGLAYEVFPLGRSASPEGPLLQRDSLIRMRRRSRRGSTEVEPSRGIYLGSPLHRRTRRPSTPGAEAPRRARATVTRMFRPRGLSPPRRLSPAGSCRFVAPCCRSWDSLRFTPDPPDGPKTGSALPEIPAARDHPSKNPPRQQPCRVTAAVAFMLLPLGPYETRSRAMPTSGRALRRTCRRTGVLASELDLLRRRAPSADQPCCVPAPQPARRRTVVGAVAWPEGSRLPAAPPPPEGGGRVASIRRWTRD